MAMPAESVSSSTESVGGEIREDEHGKKFIRVYAADTITVGRPYVVTYDGDEATNPKTASPATLAVYQYVGVATETVSSGDMTWLQIKGDCDFALVTGDSDVAKDDFLEVTNTETAMEVDASTRSANSVAIARAAYTDTTDAATLVSLIGDRVIVAAS